MTADTPSGCCGCLPCEDPSCSEDEDTCCSSCECHPDCEVAA